MKTQVTIYGRTYDLEIKAKLAESKHVSSKVTANVTRWLEARLLESSHDNESYLDLYYEIRDFATKLHDFNLEQSPDYMINL